MTLNKDLHKIKKLSDEYTKLSDITGIETRVGKFMSDAITNYVELLVEHYEKHEDEDFTSWIEWFVFDNKFGRTGLFVKIDKQKIDICNIKSFVNFFNKHVVK